MKAHLRYLLLCVAMLCVSAASRAQLSGTYTIPNATYPTLKVFIDSLNNQGVGANVTVNFTPATNEVAPVGGYRLGSTILNTSLSATKTLTINGNGNTLTAFVGTSTTADGIFYIMGADYVTINNLMLSESAANTTTTTQMEWGYSLVKLSGTAPFDGCQYDVINGCRISLNGTNANTIGIRAAHSIAATTAILTVTGTTAFSTNSYNKFTGNTILNTTRGISLVGISNGVALYDKNNIIGGTTAALGNNITIGGTTNTCYGVYTERDSVITVSNNTFATATGQNGTFYHYYPSYGVGNLTVTFNSFNMNCSMATATAAAYYNSNSSLTQHGDPATSTANDNGSIHTISNNTIFGNNPIATSSSMYGIYHYYAYCTYMNVSNNTVSNINWNISTGSVYGIYTYYNGAPYLTSTNNTIYNISKLGQGYVYGYYFYNYNANHGKMNVSDNVFRKIANNYYVYSYYIYGPGTAAPTGLPSAILTANHNVVDSIDISLATSGYIYNYMAFYGYDTSSCSFDTVKNITLPTTGSGGMYDYFGYGYYGPNLYTSKKNCITNVTSGTGTNYIYNYLGYYTTLFDSNSITNITMNGGSGYVYTYLGYYTPGKVTHNVFNNWNLLGGSGVYWYMGYYGSPTISYNAFTNIRIQGTGSYYTYGPGYYPAVCEVSNNRWDSITVNTGTLQPWYSYVNGGTFSIHDNVMSNIKDSGNVNATNYYYYIYPGGSGSVNFYNNSLSNIEFPAAYNSTNSMGLYLGANIACNVYHNTFRITPATVGGANYGFTGIGYVAGANLDLRNNIINVNVTPTGTGFVTALRRTSGSSGTSPSNFLGSSNANIYYAPNLTNSWLYGEGTTSGSMVNTYNLTNDPSFNTPCGLFKNFMGHDKSSFTENNLVAGPLPGTYRPTGVTFAESGAVPTTAPQVITDVAGTIRPALADIGALEFSGTSIDQAPPVVSFTPIPISSYCVTTPTLVATITDVTGVSNATATAPRLYYKKSTETNAFGGGNTSSTNGWKYVNATTVSGSQYTFNFDYSLLTSAVVAGDSITYFVIAQDITSATNTGATTAGFPACPTTVVLSSANGPTNNAPASNGFKILSTPIFKATAFPSAVCQTGSAVITVNPLPVGATMQWQSSTPTGTFANIPGATGPSINTGTLTTTMFYRVIIYCGASILTTSPTDTFIVANPTVLSTTGASRCGYGSLTLSAVTPPFTTGTWYTTATGGKPFFTGSTYTTPNISSTVTYYVSGNTPNASTEMCSKLPAVAYSNTYGTYGIEMLFNNNTTNFYSTTVYPAGAGSFYVELINVATGSQVKVAGPFSVPGGTGVSNPVVLTLNWANIPAGDYILQQQAGVTGTPYLNYEYQSPTFAWPYATPSGGVQIIGPSYNNAPYGYPYYYFFFYNNVVSGNCESSTRIPVVATITPAPPITASSPNVPGICLGSSATLNVTTTNPYYGFTWTPGGATTASVTVTPTTKTVYYVLAQDPYTYCAAFDSIVMNVNSKPNAPTITPNSPTICQNSSVILTGAVAAPPGIPGTIQVGTGTTLSSGSVITPFCSDWTSAHTQYLFTQAELAALGISAGTITALDFYSMGAGGAPLQNFTMRLANVANTSTTGTMICPTYTTVYGPVTYTMPSSGWTNLNFSTTFNYTGGNLLVDVTHMNCTTCPTTPCVNYVGPNGSVQYTTTGFNSVNYAYNDNDCSIPTCTPSASYVSTQRPNIRLGILLPPPLNWLVTTNLYKNAGLTTSVSLTDTNKVVYAAPQVTTAYRAIANLFGCVSNPSNWDTVFVNPAPDVTISPAGSNTICANSSVTLCVPSGSNQTYQWYFNNVAIAGATSNCYTATAAGTYKVTAINVLTGCSATSINSVVTVNVIPAVTVTTGGPTTFCNGGSVLLTANAPTAVLYQWQKNGSNITSGGTNSTYLATTSGTYTVIVTNNLSCTNSSAGVLINVNTTPTTVTANGSTSFCAGGNVILQGPTAPATLTYQWYFNSAVIAGATTSSYTATAAGNYYLQVTDAATGCTDVSATFTITVGAPPSSTITPSPTATVCSGGTVTLTTNQAPGLTYQWKLNGGNILGATSSTYAASSAGSYTVTVAIAATPSCNGTTSTPTVVTVNPLPTATATAAGPTTFCQGSTVTLNANAGVTLGYQWNVNGTPVGGGGNAVSYIASASGSYTVKVTDASTGCSQISNAVAVTANPSPPITIQAAGPITFCQGGSVVLTPSISIGYALVWNKSGVPMVPQPSPTTSYTATTTGLYTITATNSTTGCSATSPVTSVQVNALPDPSTLPTGNTPICQSTTITIGVVVQDTNMVYQWKVNGVNINGATLNTFTTGTAGTYTVVVTNKVTGCQATSANIVVTVVTPPVATASAPGKTTICQDDSTALNANTGTGLTYQWKLNGNVILGATNATYYAKLAGNYTVLVSSGSGCTTTSNSVTITVNPRPAAYITYNTPLEFCEGSAVVLVANAGTGLTYQWLMNGSPIGNTGGFNVSATSGVYSLQVTNTFSCATVSDALTVVVHPTPVPSITRTGNTLQTTTAYTNYQWFFNNVAIGGATSGSYVFTQNGAYKVRVDDIYGCEGFSNQFFINNVGISNPALGNSIKVYPNPTTGILNVDAKVAVKLALRDVTGKAIIEVSDVKSIDMGDVANGVYLLYISDMDGHLLRAEKVTKTNN